MIFQAAKMALQAVWSSKLRSFLTMLGIIIGVFALVVLVSLVHSTTDHVAGIITNLGGSYLTVNIEDDKGHPLKLEDMDAIMDEGIGIAAPCSQSNVTGKNGRVSTSVIVYGTTAVYPSINMLSVEYGTFLRDSNIDNHSNVAVINTTLAETLMGTTDCLGQTVNLNGMPFQIIGILSDDIGSLTNSYSSWMSVAYIPYSTAQRLNFGVYSNIRSFQLSALPGGTAEEAQAAITDFLMERFGQDEEAFTISDNAHIEDAMREINGVLELLLGGIAAISLIVGGIGIMNIMLVSVTERTKEIGIRKAIGASRGTIMLQFLIEALVLSLLGCILGLVLSAVTLWTISYFVQDISFTVSPEIALVAICFAMAVGLIFGINPANKAARKQPIDALRYSG